MWLSFGRASLKRTPVFEMVHEEIWGCRQEQGNIEFMYIQKNTSLQISGNNVHRRVNECARVSTVLSQSIL